MTGWPRFQESRSFRVYYGTDPNTVKDSVYGDLLGDTELVELGQGVTTSTITFSPATTYYWRVDVVNGGNVYADEKVHTFSTGIGNSHNFLPTDGRTGLAINKVNLIWAAGSIPVTGYNVYLGTDQTSVTNGTNGTKVSSLQTTTSYVPLNLVENVTYFWRIEDVATPIVSSAVMSFTTTSVAADPNLVGWWKFDQIGASDAADSSGAGNVGSFVGSASIVADGTGAALSLNGTTDYVNITGYKGVLGTKSRTTCAWIKTSGEGAIISWGTDAAGQKWHVQVDPTFEIRAGVSSGYAVGKTKVSDNKWHHIVNVIVDDNSPNSNEILTYIDGVKEITTGAARAMDTLSGNDVAIGNWIPENDYFTGLIKDVKIYDRPLTHQEVLEMMEVNTAQGQTPDGATGLGVQVTLNWVAAYADSRSFNVYYGKTSEDVNNSQPGSLLNDTVLAQVSGLTSLVVNVDPGSTYYWRVDVVGSAVYKDPKIHTFTTAIGNSYNFDPADGQTGLAPNKTVFSWTPGSLAVTGYNVFLGTDQTNVANGTNGTLVSSLQTDTSYRPTPTLAENTTYFWRIEDVRTPIYSSEVMTFTTGTNTDPNLVGHWHFDNVTDTSVPDMSGNNHTGTMVGNASITDDLQMGKVLTLDGTGDYVRVFDYKGIAGAASRTICAWIKTSKTGANYQGIVAWGQSTTGKSWDFVVYDSKLRQMAYNNNRTGSSIVTDGNWHHVASVFGGGDFNTVKVYVDGIEDVLTGASVTVDTGNTRDLRIGDTDSLGSRQFNGMIDDVRLYNRVLTAQEIKDICEEKVSYIIIDSMEDYNDITKPIDGSGGWRDNDFNPEVGGHTYIGKAGIDPVLKGKQSLKFAYDNSDWTSPIYHNSETVKIFDTLQDWSFATSEKKVKILTIPVRGVSSNGKDKLYTALEDDAGHSYTLYHPDPNVLINETWQIWEINTDEFKNRGVNMARIKKIFLGVGNRNEINFPDWRSGTVYFDHLTLNPPHCRPEFSPAYDLTRDCVVDLADLRTMANNWLKSDIIITPETVSTDGLKVHWTFDAGTATDISGNGNNGTLNTATTIIDDAARDSKVANFAGAGSISMPVTLFSSVSSEITISFWANGGDCSACRKLCFSC